MGYYGIGDIDGTGWCSDLNIPTNCTPITGICKPMTHAANDAIKLLQTQLNRIAYVRKESKVDVDGRIGPASVKRVNSVLGMTFSHCDGVMAMVEQLGKQAYMLAESLSAPAKVPAPVTSLPSVNQPDGTVKHPPVLATSVVGMFKSPLGLAAAGVGILLLWQATKPKKKKKKKKAKRRKKRVVESYRRYA